MRKKVDKKYVLCAIKKNVGKRRTISNIKKIKKGKLIIKCQNKRILN